MPRLKKQEACLIEQIAERFVKLVYLKGDHARLIKIEVMADLATVQGRGNLKLNLTSLLKAEPFDVLHDITGIHANLNRGTGNLENYFRPRTAKS